MEDPACWITMATDSITTDTEILTMIISPQQANLDPPVADSILRLRFSSAQNERMRELAEKGNQGVLTEVEALELASYRRVGNSLSIMQAKPRLSLRPSSNSH
ncbi:MAG: hypothetical protein WD894_05325 [Pirellulales bacterium]